MQLLAIERELPAGIYARSETLLRAEAAAVWKLQQSGLVRQLWSTAADRRTLLLFECSNAAEARRHLATLPMVEHGTVEFSVLELRNYDGFEHLFASDKSPAARIESASTEAPEY